MSWVLDPFVPAKERDLVKWMLDLDRELFVLLCVRNLRPRMGIENLLKRMVEVLNVSSKINICRNRSKGSYAKRIEGVHPAARIGIYCLAYTIYS